MAKNGDEESFLAELQHKAVLRVNKTLKKWQLKIQKLYSNTKIKANCRD